MRPVYTSYYTLIASHDNVYILVHIYNISVGLRVIDKSVIIVCLLEISLLLYRSIGLWKAAVKTTSYCFVESNKLLISNNKNNLWRHYTTIILCGNSYSDNLLCLLKNKKIIVLWQSSACCIVRCGCVKTLMLMTPMTCHIDSATDPLLIPNYGPVEFQTNGSSCKCY